MFVLWRLCLNIIFIFLIQFFFYFLTCYKTQLMFCVTNRIRYIDIDIGTKHRLVAFKRPIIFIYFDSHCRFMDILAAKFQY